MVSMIYVDLVLVNMYYIFLCKYLHFYLAIIYFIFHLILFLSNTYLGFGTREFVINPDLIFLSGFSEREILLVIVLVANIMLYTDNYLPTPALLGRYFPLLIIS